MAGEQRMTFIERALKLIHEAVGAHREEWSKYDHGMLDLAREADAIAAQEAIERIPASLYWMIARGRLRPIEPLFAVQLIDAESAIVIAEAEAETLPAAIDAAISRLPAT